MSQSKEIEPAINGEVMAYDPSMFPELRWQDPEEATSRFTARFMAANNVEGLFNVLEGNSSKDMVGRRIEIAGVDWVAYQTEDGVIPNALCTAVDIDTGEMIEFATTARLLTMFIRRAELIDALPLRVKIAEITTRSGRKALNFVKP